MQARQDPDRKGLRARGEDRHDHLVEREREGQQRASEERGAHLRKHHEAESLPVVRAEVGRGLVEVACRPTHAGDDVVVDHDDAERRVVMMIVVRPNVRPSGPRTSMIVACSASPVTLPGRRSADHGEVITSRPKNQVARDGDRRERPRLRKIAVAPSAA